MTTDAGSAAIEKETTNEPANSPRMVTRDTSTFADAAMALRTCAVTDAVCVEEANTAVASMFNFTSLFTVVLPAIEITLSPVDVPTLVLMRTLTLSPIPIDAAVHVIRVDEYTMFDAHTPRIECVGTVAVEVVPKKLRPLIVSVEIALDLQPVKLPPVAVQPAAAGIDMDEIVGMAADPENAMDTPSVFDVPALDVSTIGTTSPGDCAAMRQVILSFFVTV